MRLTIFDLDNTLLHGDSDYAWGNFLVDKGVVDGDYYQRENDRFYEEYKNKTLDVFEYQRFALKPLTSMTISERESLHQEFMTQVVQGMQQPKAQALVAQHKQQGDTLLVITATNYFITAPIVRALGIDHLLATDPEIIDDQFTGEVKGIPCFQEGKIERLQQWLSEQDASFSHTTFYSDSINDAPLLEYADTSIAVDPDERLSQIAKEKHWQIISLRS